MKNKKLLTNKVICSIMNTRLKKFFHIAVVEQRQLTGFIAQRRGSNPTAATNGSGQYSMLSAIFFLIFLWGELNCKIVKML